MTRRRIQSWVSTVMLAISLGLFALVAVLYFQGDDEPSEPPAPTAVPGLNRAIDVLNALRAQGLEAEFGQQGSVVQSDALDRPGQAILLESGTAYVFIYPDPASQEDVLLDLALDEIDIDGALVDVESTQLSANSNVAVLLVNGTVNEAEQVAEAIASLP